MIAILLLLAFICVGPPAVAAEKETQITEKMVDETNKMSNQAIYKIKSLYKQGLAFLFNNKWYIIGVFVLSLGIVFIPIPEFIRFFFVRVLIITVLGVTLYITAPIIIGELSKGI